MSSDVSLMISNFSLGLFMAIVVCGTIVFDIYVIVVYGRRRRKMKTEKYPEGNFDGRIIINTRDPNKDIFRLEYDGNVTDIPTKEYVIFQVVREDL